MSKREFGVAGNSRQQQKQIPIQKKKIDIIEKGDFRMKKLKDEMKTYEKLRIQDALIYLNWDKTKTAKYLGIGLSSLYRKIKELKIEKD